MVLCGKIVEVLERVTEAVTGWMTVDSCIEMYANREEWFKKVAGHAERKTARETRAQTMDKFKDDAKQGAGLLNILMKWVQVVRHKKRCMLDAKSRKEKLRR